MSRYKYRNVVFLDDSQDFDTWYSYYDENAKEGFEYLLRWEHGDSIPEESTPPWGASDTIEYFHDGDLTYAVSYNWHLSYVSLTEIIE